MKSRSGQAEAHKAASDVAATVTQSDPGTTPRYMLAIVVFTIVGCVCGVCVVISQQQGHALKGAPKRATTAAVGPEAKDASKLPSSEAPSATASEHGSSCRDQRPECKEWSLDKTVSDIDRKDHPLLYSCDGLNKGFMSIACRATCGLCKSTTAPPPFSAPAAPPVKASTAPVPAALLKLKPVVLESAWPSLVEFFTVQSDRFRVFVDDTCTTPDETKGSNRIRGSWCVDNKGSVVCPKESSGKEKDAQTIFGGWDNPQCGTEHPRFHTAWCAMRLFSCGSLHRCIATREHGGLSVLIVVRDTAQAFLIHRERTVFVVGSGTKSLPRRHSFLRWCRTQSGRRASSKMRTPCWLNCGAPV